MTPDDEARLREPFRASGEPPHEVQLSGQARPNVLFEAGMAMAWNQERTVLVELGELRPFSDVAGRHVVRLDGSSPRRQEFAQRLEAAGCPVNLDGVEWHTAGDFDTALRGLDGLDQTVGTSPATTPTAEAQTLLLQAVRGDGTLMKLETFSGLQIVPDGGYDLVEEGNPRSEARWKGAVDELVAGGLLEDRVGRDEIFHVTAQGFDVADVLNRALGNQA